MALIPPKGAARKILRLFSGYCRDESGAIIVFITIMFAFLMAFGGLVFDIGRIYNLYSQSQSYIDSVAVTSAAELDGESGAIVRAVRAAIGDSQRGSLLNPGSRLSMSGDKLVNVQSLVFMESIAGDPAPGTRSPVAGDVVLCTYETGALTCAGGITQAAADQRTRFVLVNATIETENFVLFPIATAFIPDILQQASVEPQAVAGFTREICNFTPLGFCNPTESNTPPYGGDYTPVVGQQILLKTNAQLAPGNYGLVQQAAGIGGTACNNNSGANLVRCSIAVADPDTQCVSSVATSTIDLQTGQETNPVKDGFNIRFDIFDPPLNNKTSDPAFAPASNVTKGRMHNAGQCKFNQLSVPPAQSNTVALPRDSCFATNTCSGGRFGNGVTAAQLQSYWTTNHGGTLPAGLTTRYDVYRYETDNNLIPNKSGLNPKGENGNATCASSSISDVNKDRRIIRSAVVNCLESDIHGNTSGVPVISLAKLFVTEPVGLDGSDNIYAEVLDIGADVANPGGSGSNVQHEYARLYR